jgi:hypothetical protein
VVDGSISVVLDLDGVGPAVAEVSFELPSVEVDVPFACLLAVDLLRLARLVDPLPGVRAEQRCGLGDMTWQELPVVQGEVAEQAA